MKIKEGYEGLAISLTMLGIALVSIAIAKLVF